MIFTTELTQTEVKNILSDYFKQKGIGVIKSISFVNVPGDRPFDTDYHAIRVNVENNTSVA